MCSGVSVCSGISMNPYLVVPPDEHLNFLNKFTTCKQKMAAINVCDKTKLGKTTRLKLNSINLSDKVYSLKQNICKELENSLENIGKYDAVR